TAESGSPSCPSCGNLTSDNAITLGGSGSFGSGFNGTASGGVSWFSKVSFGKAPRDAAVLSWVPPPPCPPGSGKNEIGPTLMAWLTSGPTPGGPVGIQTTTQKTSANPNTWRRNEARKL